VRNTSHAPKYTAILDNIQANGLRDQLMTIKSENVIHFLFILEVMIKLFFILGSYCKCLESGYFVGLIILSLVSI